MVASTWAVANQKGGVGKTTVTPFIAEALAALGRKILVVDLDPQASATKVLGADVTTAPSRADLLLGEGGHSGLEVPSRPAGVSTSRRLRPLSPGATLTYRLVPSSCCERRWRTPTATTSSSSTARRRSAC